MRKITEEEFLKRFKKYTGNYIPIGPYVDYNEKYKVKHSCGYEYYIIPKYFFRGKYKCPICNITHKTTDEIFKIKLLRTFPKFDQDFEILSPYNGYDDSITVRLQLPTGLACGIVSPRIHYKSLNSQPTFGWLKSACPDCNDLAYVFIILTAALISACSTKPQCLQTYLFLFLDSLSILPHSEHFCEVK